MRNPLKLSLSAAVAAVAIASAVGIAIGASAGNGDSLDLAVLDAPPARTAPIPDTIGGVPFAEIHSKVALGDRRLARISNGRSIFVAPSNEKAGDVCLLIVAVSGAAASTCNGPSVVADYGSIPHLEFDPDQSIQVTAIVPDDVTAARADDGTVGSIENNVMSMHVGPNVDGIELISDAGGSTTLKVGIWRDPQP